MSKLSDKFPNGGYFFKDAKGNFHGSKDTSQGWTWYATPDEAIDAFNIGASYDAIFQAFTIEAKYQALKYIERNELVTGFEVDGFGLDISETIDGL
jgi:hypothetical protein